jgi:hypothetical protein
VRAALEDDACRGGWSCALSGIIHPHSVFAALSMYQWALSIGAHEARHADQPREIAAAVRRAGLPPIAQLISGTLLLWSAAMWRGRTFGRGCHCWVPSAARCPCSASAVGTFGQTFTFGAVVFTHGV